jgi:hypothetical protein
MSSFTASSRVSSAMTGYGKSSGMSWQYDLMSYSAKRYKMGMLIRHICPISMPIVYKNITLYGIQKVDCEFKYFTISINL